MQDAERYVWSANDIFFAAVLLDYGLYRGQHGEDVSEECAERIAQLCHQVDLGPSCSADTLGFTFSPTVDLSRSARRRVHGRLINDSELWALAVITSQILNQIPVGDVEFLPLDTLAQRLPRRHPHHSAYSPLRYAYR